MSLLQFPRHSAVFVDKSGNQVGSKTFGYSFGSLGQKKKTFNYDGGTYNIVPDKSTRLKVDFGFKLIFDDYIFIYMIGNPDPISLRGGKFTPIMNPKVYCSRLRSNLIIDLYKAGSGKFEINWTYVIGGIIALIVVYYVANGGFTIGDLTGAGNVVSETSKNITGVLVN